MDPSAPADPPSPPSAALSPLGRAFDAIRTPEEAERVAADLAATAGGITCEDASSARVSPAQPSAAAIVQAATVVQNGDAPTRRAVGERIFQVANPQTDPTRAPEQARRRSLLRTALLARLRPLDRLDALLFMAINRMPHPPLVNRALHGLSIITKGGKAQTVGLLLAVLPRGRRGWQDLAAILPAFWLATATVEVPMKRYVRRRRPFLTEVAAVVIGRRPGSYTFPSGHTAAAFAFCTLVGRRFPRAAGPCWALAALIGFSRVYLGAHYPGDVLTGAVSGGVLARAFALIFRLLSAPRPR